MKKTLKSIQKKHGMLNEAYAWERTSGGALPTLADVQAKYNAKSVNEQGQIPISQGGDTLSSSGYDSIKRVYQRSADKGGYISFKIDKSMRPGFGELEFRDNKGKVNKVILDMNDLSQIFNDDLYSQYGQ